MHALPQRLGLQILSLASQEKADGGRIWVILGLKSVSVWAGNAIDLFPLPSCGSMCEHWADPVLSLGAVVPALRN